MADSSAFLVEQQQAIERMREMSKRGMGGQVHSMPPAPSFVKVGGVHNYARDTVSEKNEKKVTKNNASLFDFNIPFLDKIQSESDITIIIGILLLLWGEKSDKLLLLALLYLLF